jgi:hypothetical protein
MRILVTSASGANGNGYGAVLSFGPEGDFMGPFSKDPRTTDPRGMAVDPSGALVYLNATPISSASRQTALLASTADSFWSPAPNPIRSASSAPRLRPG